MSKNTVQLNVKLNVKPADINKQIDNLSAMLKPLKISATLDLGNSAKMVNAKIDKLSDSVKKLQLIGSINVAKTKENIKNEIKKLGDNLVVNTKIKVDTKQAQQEINKVNGSQVKSKSLEFDITQFQRKMAIVKKTLSDSKSHKVDSGAMSDLMKQIDNLSSRTPNARQEIRKLNMDMKELASNSKHVESSMGTAIKGMVMWSVAATAFYAPIRAMQSMTAEILEIDKQMTNLKRVMDLPSYEFANMLERTMNMSNELGVSVKNSLKVMEGFAKQGYKGTDLDSLTKTTELLQTLSDLTPEQSVNTLTSTMANFNIEAKDAMSIGNKLNEIDNQTTASTLILSDGLRKSAATASTFGVSLNSTLGYITAINSGTKESGAIIGNSLKTIFSRITTNESATSALSEIGVSINDLEGNVKPVEKILGEVANKWGDLSDAQQQHTAIGVAGQYQLSRFLTLMTQYDTALSASEIAENSNGSLMRENAKYLDSYEAKLSRMSNAWTELSLAVGGAFLNDGLTAGINALTDLAKVVAAVVKVTGVLPVVLGGVSVAALLLSKNLRTLTMALASGTFGMSKSRVEAVNLAANMTRAQVASKLLSISLKGLAMSTVVGAGFAILGAVIEGLTKKYYENKQAQDDLEATQAQFMQSYKDNAVEVDELAAKFSKLQETINSGNYNNETMTEYLSVQNELSELLPQLKLGEDNYGNALIGNSAIVQSRIDLTKEQIEIEKELNAEKAKSESESRVAASEKTIKKANKKKDKVFNRTAMNVNEGLINYDMDTQEDIQVKFGEMKSIDDLKEKLSQLEKAKIKASKAGKDNQISAYDNAIDSVKEAISTYSTYENTVKKALLTIRDESLKSLDDTMKANNDMAESSKKAFSNIMSSATLNTDSVDSLSAFQKMIEEIGSNDALQDKMDEFNRETNNLATSSEENFGKASKSAKKNFKEINESILDESNLKVGSKPYNDLSKSLDIASASAIAHEEKSRKMAEAQGLSIESARVQVTAEEDSAEAIETVSSKLDEQITKMQEMKTVSENAAGVSQEQVDATLQAVSAYTMLSGVVQENTVQEQFLEQQMNILAKLYPHMSDMIKGSAEERKKAISIIDAENNANSVLLKVYALAADGKMKIEGNTTLQKLEQTNARIKLINDEIAALDDLQKAYINAINNRDQDALHTVGDMRNERFSIQLHNSTKSKRAELAKLSTSQKKYTTSLESTVTAIENETSSTGSGSKAKANSTKETTKSIYTTDAYRVAMDKLTKAQEKNQRQISKYPTYSKEYRKALREQIKLKEKERALDENQAESLKKQIKNRKIIVSGSGSIKKSEKLLTSTTTTTTKTSSGKVVKTSSGKGSNKDRVWAFLKNEGYSDAAASGVIGNLMQESGTNLNTRIAEIKGQGKIGGKGGYGLLQWTGGRRRELEKFAKQKKADIGDLDLQLAFLKKELNSKAYQNDFTKLIGGYSKLTKNNSVSSATTQFEKVMERAGNKQITKRVNYAKNTYDSYSGKSITTVSNPVKQTETKSKAKTTTRKLSGWNGKITSAQGKRGSGNHNGTDIASPLGTRLDSNVSGKVVAAGKATDFGYDWSYGNMVAIKAKNGKEHLYAHLQSASVKKGDTVKKGNAIGKTGSTGNSTGPHLHYTVDQGKGNSMSYVKAARGSVKGVSSSKISSKSNTITTKVTTKGRADKTKESIDGAKETLRQLTADISASKDEVSEIRQQINDSYIESFDRKVEKREQKMTKRQHTKDRSNGTSKEYKQALKDDRSDIKYIINKTKDKRDFIKDTLKTKGLTRTEKDNLKDELDVISENLNQYTTDLMNNTAEEIERKHNDKRNTIEHQDLDISKEESYRETVSNTGSGYYSSIKRQEKDMASKEKALKEDLKIAVSESKNKKKNSAKIRREQDKLAETIRAELTAHKKSIQELELQRVETKTNARNYDINKKDGSLSQQSSLQSLMNTTSKAYNNSTILQIQTTKDKRALLQSELNYAVTQGKNMKLGSEGMKAQRQRAIEIRQQLIENSIALTELEKQKSDFKINKNDDAISDLEYLIQRSQTYSDSLLDNDLGKATQMGEQIAAMRKKKDELVAKNSLYLEEMKNKKLTAEQQKEYRKALQQNKLSIVDLESEIRGVYKTTADTMIDLYKQVYEKRKELELEAIEKERKNYQKLVNDKVEALNKLNQEDDHKEEKSDYQKNIAKLEKKINSYNGDDSKQGKYEKSKAEEELAELKKEYDKFMRDYETENKIDEWQKDLDNKEEELDDATKATDDYFENILNDERKYNKMRQEILKGNVDAFKSELEGMGEFITGNMSGIGTSISESILDQIELAVANLNVLGDEMNGSNNNVTKPNGDVAGIGGSTVSTGTPSSSNASKNITTKKATKMYYTTDTKSKVLETIPKGKTVPYSQLSSDKKWYEVTFNKKTGWVLKSDLVSTVTKSTKDTYGNTTKTTTTTNEFGTTSKSTTETNKEGTVGTTKKYDSSGALISTEYKQGKAKEKIAILEKADKTSKTIKTLAKDDKFDVMDSYSYYAKINYKGFVGYIPKSKLIGLETGGYTGDNVPKSGGLALLHKKELVLNAQQTKDIFNTVKLVDSFMSNPKPSNIAATTTSASTENNLHIENLVTIDKFTGTETDIKKLTAEVEKNLVLGMKKIGMTRR